MSIFEKGTFKDFFPASFAFLIFTRVCIYILPRRFSHSRNLAFGSHFAETNPAKPEIAQISVLAAAAKTPPDFAGAEFRLFARSGYD